jgi:hypothetical protein
MHTILDQLAPEHQANPTSDAALIAQSERIAEAYAAVFTGAGSKVDADLVLVDLAAFTRYYDTALLREPAEVVKAIDARRAVFQRILEAMTRAGMEPNGIHGALLRTPPIDVIEEN